MKRSLIILLSVFLCWTHIWGEESDASGPIRYKSHYAMARQLDSSRVYSESRRYYIELIQDFLTKHQSGKIRESDYAVIYPLVLSSVYRLSYVNWHYTHSSLFQLGYQMDAYEEVNGLTDSVIASLLEVSALYPDLQLEACLPFLYYARAVTKLAWADALMTGIMWKHYMVVPVQDLWAMVDDALLDIQDVLRAFKLPYPLTDTSFDDYRSQLETIVFQKDPHSVFYKSFLLLFPDGRHDGDRLRQLRNSVYFHGAKVLDLNAKWWTRWIRRTSSSRLTIDSVVSLRNKPMFKLMDRYVEQLIPDPF